MSNNQKAHRAKEQAVRQEIEITDDPGVREMYVRTDYGALSQDAESAANYDADEWSGKEPPTQNQIIKSFCAYAVMYDWPEGLWWAYSMSFDETLDRMKGVVSEKNEPEPTKHTHEHCQHNRLAPPILIWACPCCKKEEGEVAEWEDGKYCFSGQAPRCDECDMQKEIVNGTTQDT